jgi:hypothetical protein
MARLLGASILWGMGFAIVVLTVTAMGCVITKSNPHHALDFTFSKLFLWLTALGAIWRYRRFFSMA